LSSIKAPKFKQQRGDKVFSKYEEFAYESKEFLREKLSQNSLVQIKKLTIKDHLEQKMIKKRKKTEKTTEKTTDKKELRKYVTITQSKKNFSLELVQSGLASVVRHSGDEERSSIYDKLSKAELDAKNKKIGIHGNLKDATEHSITDLTNSKDNGDENKKMFSLIKERKTPGIIDKVLSGARFKNYFT